MFEISHELLNNSRLAKGKVFNLSVTKKAFILLEIKIQMGLHLPAKFLVIHSKIINLMNTLFFYKHKAYKHT